MRIFDADWQTALANLEAGMVVSRVDSVWKNSEMRLTSDGRFQDRHYIEGILEHCEPHWTEWEDTERQTFPANTSATDWLISEAI